MLFKSCVALLLTSVSTNKDISSKKRRASFEPPLPVCCVIQCHMTVLFRNFVNNTFIFFFRSEFLDFLMYRTSHNLASKVLKISYF